MGYAQGGLYFLRNNIQHPSHFITFTSSSQREVYSLIKKAFSPCFWQNINNSPKTLDNHNFTILKCKKHKKMLPQEKQMIAVYGINSFHPWQNKEEYYEKIQRHEQRRTACTQSTAG